MLVAMDRSPCAVVVDSVPSTRSMGDAIHGVGRLTDWPPPADGPSPRRFKAASSAGRFAAVIQTVIAGGLAAWAGFLIAMTLG